MTRSGPPVDFVDLMVRAHEALESADMRHAFGGALALAWCVEEARGTQDIDLNIFVPVNDLGRVLEALPDDIEVSERARMLLERDGQARLWWSRIPLDLFLTNDPFHEAVAERISQREFADRLMPFLACEDLAVFKAFFDRDKDWIDIRDMMIAGCVNEAELGRTLADLLGTDDFRLDKLRAARDAAEDMRRRRAASGQPRA
ncbi:MAG: hypothetical protein F4Y76_01875 [Acidimicrobiales bacterium]|nr:hypothetical protein [Acidimicrobiales bacterium]MYG60600.1 hypothetical protein [Acidimicrobiales bacterium]MYJ46880.1 hypothetical protein [Acidimicrobiales bacterium]